MPTGDELPILAEKVYLNSRAVGAVSRRSMAYLAEYWSMRPDPGIFREYDVRGVLGRDLDPGVAARVGWAYGRFLQEQLPDRAGHAVVVGRDNRASSPALWSGLVRGLAAAGCRVVDIGMVVTPIFYFARVHYGLPGGVMITGSHNPPEYNGFKLGEPGSHGTLYGGAIQELGRLARRAPAELDREAAGAGAPGSAARLERRDPVPAYLETIAGRVRLGPRRIKVVVDAGNGTASPFAPELYRRLGCEVVPLYCDPDPAFPHHFPDPVEPENLRDLIATVRREGADVGLAFDGDADRLGAVDEKGQIVWGDQLMILFWREILPRHPGAPAIVEVKCSQALVDEIVRLGGRPVFYKTGHSLIKAKLKELGAVFTGEMSGHLFFADEYFGYDDALYAGGRLLRLLSNAPGGETLSSMLATAPRYLATPETRVACPDAAKFRVVDQVRRELVARFGPERVVTVDGARVTFPDGWALIRASNTQPVLVVRAEGRDAAALERMKALVAEVLAGYPEVGPIPW